MYQDTQNMNKFTASFIKIDRTNSRIYQQNDRLLLNQISQYPFYHMCTEHPVLLSSNKRKTSIFRSISVSYRFAFTLIGMVSVEFRCLGHLDCKIRCNKLCFINCNCFWWMIWFSIIRPRKKILWSILACS